MRTDQTAQLAMTPELRQAIGLLSLGNVRLGAYLAGVARRNPHVALRLPRPQDGARGGARGGGVAEEDRIAAPSGGLAEHVASQIRLQIDPHRQGIACAFLEALEPWGWLGRGADEIASDCGCDVEDAEAVLASLQLFDPPGIFARSLAECLRLQAAERGVLDPVMAALLDRLDLVAAGDAPALARHCGVDAGRVGEAIRALRQFDPKPGLAFEVAAEPLRAPDLVVTRRGEGWRVALNPATLPEVALVEDVREWHAPVAPDALREAHGLKRAIQRRNASMLAVARAVVARQKGFLEGADHAAPMTLAEVADAASLHVSTVSRVAADLTADTPRGTLRLRRLFGRGLPRGGSAVVAVGEVRDRIADLVRAETGGEALSDDRIAAELRGSGLRITRRTVTKYRAALGIPAVRDRRRARPSAGDA